jgi:ribosomal-protein-serine acetyltransferase
MLEHIKIHKDGHLRFLKGSDANELFSLIDKNREHLSLFLEWPRKTKTVKDSMDFINFTLKKSKNGSSTYGIFFKGDLAGIAGYHPIDFVNKKASLGYWLGEEYQGNGLVTNSVKFLLKNGFKTLELNRIEMTCALENKLSQAVAERLNFKKEGVLRSAEIIGNCIYDHIIYSIIKNEYSKCE